jgi:hypothetical protein
MARFPERTGSGVEIKRWAGCTVFWTGSFCGYWQDAPSAADLLIQPVFFRRFGFYTCCTFRRIPGGLTTNQRHMNRARYSSVNTTRVIIQPEDNAGSVYCSAV